MPTGSTVVPVFFKISSKKIRLCLRDLSTGGETTMCYKCREGLQCVTSAAKVRMASAAVRAVSQVKIFPAVRFLAVLATKRMDWMCCFGNVLLDVWFNRRREGGADQWTGRDGDRVLSAGESAWGVLFARTDSMILTRRCSLLNVRNDNRYHCSIQNQALKSPHHR